MKTPSPPPPLCSRTEETALPPPPFHIRSPTTSIQPTAHSCETFSSPVVVVMGVSLQAAPVLAFFVAVALVSPILAFTPAVYHRSFAALRSKPQCQNPGFGHGLRFSPCRKPAVLFMKAGPEEASAVSEETSASTDDLEDGWKVAEDPSSGRMYYWNSETREVSWYRPAKKVKGVARAMLADIEEYSDVQEVSESSEEGDRERTEAELAAKRERKEKRKAAAQERAQRMQSYLADKETQKEQKNMVRSPTKQVEDLLSQPKAPKLQDTVVSLFQSARGEQPSLADKESEQFIAWLDKAYDEQSPEEDASGISIPGLLLRREEVARGDVIDFDMRVKLARDPQKALETATARALKRGQEELARAMAEAQGQVTKSAQEALIEAARSGGKLTEEAAQQSKGFFSRVFSRKAAVAPPAAPPTAVAASSTDVEAAAPEAEAAPAVETEEQEMQDGYPTGAFEFSIAGQSGGQPKENQDTTLLAQVDKNAAIYAVFDGHGQSGAAVSQFISEKLREALSQALKEVRAQNLGKDELKKRVKAAFLDADAGLSESLQEYFGLEFDGSTGCAVIRNEKDVLIAFVGDSSCVVGWEGGKAKRLTKDHTPASPGERFRIESSGGMVAAFPDEPPPEISGKGRVFVADQMFPGLAVSRAFGDLVAKTVGVIAEPECVDYTVTGKEVLIVGSDGVWDVLSNEEAVQICMQHYERKDAVLATADLVEAARKKWELFQEDYVKEGGSKSDFSIDDISAVTVFL